jgi:DNA invertase Pin-like site-specific DNA recombinase
MRVCLYARVSTENHGQDTDNQLAQLREFCSRQDWQIVQEYVENVSAKTSKRPQFQAMLQAAERRRFDLVLFWSLDRFSREGVLDTLQHLQRLTSAGCGWKSYTEQYLDSCGVFRDAVLSILATIAKQERIRLSERTKAGLEKARRKGKTLGAPRSKVPRDEVRAARAAGESISQVADRFGISRALVCKICKEEQA